MSPGGSGGTLREPTPGVVCRSERVDPSASPRDPLGRCEPGQFRDLSFGVSVLRRFGGSGIHPYALVGVAKLWRQNRTSLARWTDNDALYRQAGMGLIIPLSSRLALVPEVRFDYLVLGAILRPNIALVYGRR